MYGSGQGISNLCGPLVQGPHYSWVGPRGERGTCGVINWPRGAYGGGVPNPVCLVLNVIGKYRVECLAEDGVTKTGDDHSGRPLKTKATDVIH